MISTKLSKGTYTILLEAVSMGVTDDTDVLDTDECLKPYLYFSIQIHPYERLSELLPSDLDEYSAGFPEIQYDFTMDYDSPGMAFSDTHRFIDVKGIKLKNSAILKAYKFSVPKPDELMKNKGLSGAYALTLTICKF